MLDHRKFVKRVRDRLEARGLTRNPEFIMELQEIAESCQAPAFNQAVGLEFTTSSDLIRELNRRFPQNIMVFEERVTNSRTEICYFWQGGVPKAMGLAVLFQEHLKGMIRVAGPVVTKDSEDNPNIDDEGGG